MTIKKTKKITKKKVVIKKKNKKVKVTKKVLVKSKNKKSTLLRIKPQKGKKITKKSAKIFKKPKKKIILKKKNKIRLIRIVGITKKKVVARPFKYRKKIILPKSKLFNIVNKKPVLKKTKIVIKKEARKQNLQKPQKKQVIKITQNKVVRKEEVSTSPVESLFKAKIKVVGIGGGGGSIVSEIGKSLNKATFVIADTDIRALKKKTGIKYFWFGEEFTHGLGTGVNPEIAQKAAESEKGKISEIFKDQDIVILIASLGGGLGSGATQVFAQAAKSFGGITLGIFTLPFRFEGKNKSKIAQKALKELKKSLNVSITIPNERIFKIIDNNTSITDAFSTVNKNLIESLESLIDLIYNPGLINIDFADLRAILNGNGDTAFLNTVQASGKDRVGETIKKILNNPLYQNNNFIAERILFNISGGTNLNMFEVEKISSSISDFNPKAKIIFGISKNIKSKNKIKTTILMTGPQKNTEEVPEKIIVKKAEITKKAKVIQKLPSAILPVGDLIPVFNKDQATSETSSKLIITGPSSIKVKKTIRRNALEIRKAEEIEQDKRLLQEEEWEVPAFLRRVKFKS